MTAPSSSSFLFNHHHAAEAAVSRLVEAGIDVKKLSIVARGYRTAEHVVGFYADGDKIKAWGGAGAFWGGIWGLLMAPAIFFLPGLGLVAMAGPLVATVVSRLEGAVVVAGVSVIGAALMQLGVPKDQAVNYDMALKVDKYLLVVQGSESDQDKARVVLDETPAPAVTE